MKAWMIERRWLTHAPDGEVMVIPIRAISPTLVNDDLRASSDVALEALLESRNPKPEGEWNDEDATVLYAVDVPDNVVKDLKKLIQTKIKEAKEER